MERVVDRTGFVWADLTWSRGRLVTLAVPGATVHGDVIEDELLGEAHRITGARTTTMSALDWKRPTVIPTLAAPGSLARGAGGSIMNVIAALAVEAGIGALRYAGPYPTHALYRTLVRSFRTTASEAAFTAELEARAARLAREPLELDFVPAPHERVAITGGHVELRDGLQRVVHEGIAYEREGSPARIVDDRCEIWFGDRPYAHVLTISAAGKVVAGPHPIPFVQSDVVGQEFPHALAVAIGELVSELVPRVLAADARDYFARTPIRWGDLGARAASQDDHGLVVHAALWDRLAPLGLGRLALALAEALAPVVTSALVHAVMLTRSK